MFVWECVSDVDGSVGVIVWACGCDYVGESGSLWVWWP